MITVESDNMWCGSSPVGKSRKPARHWDPCWGQFQDTLRRLERTPCLSSLPTKLTPALTLSAQKKNCQKVNWNFKLTKSKNFLFCLVPSTSHTKVSIKAQNHQAETDRRCGTFWLNTRPKVGNIELINGPMHNWHSFFCLFYFVGGSGNCSKPKETMFVGWN